jgi:hypothetical protein
MTAEPEAPDLSLRLIHAVQSRQYEEATQLLAAGADPRITDETGLTAVDYALLSGDVPFFTHIYKENRRINVETVMTRFPDLCQTFLALPDFRVSFNYKVKSWVPFVSMFCPSDTWVLTKVGSRLRIDTSLANWSGFRWTRGSISIYFDASSPEMLDSFLAIDNVSGDRISVLREIVESADIDEDIHFMTQLDLLKGFIQVESIQKYASRNWFGFRVGPTQHDGTWRAQPVDLGNIKIKFIHWLCTDFGAPEPQMHEYVKTYSGRFWCSTDFPVQPPMLVPFLEALAPFRETARNVLMVFGMFEDGMPVKGEVNVFPTVKMEFSFDHYSGDIDAFRDEVVPPAPPEPGPEPEPQVTD